MSIVVGERYLHKRRGAWYEVLGLAKMQIGASTFAHKLDGHEDVACSVLEKKSLVVYRSLDDDTLWVRPESEFLDGRFEREGWE